jgi:hypothetical protein
MKAQWSESRGRILRGDNTGGGAVTLPPVRFQCIGVWFSAGLSCMYTHNWPCILSSDLRRIRLALNLPERYCCASRGVSIDAILLKKQLRTAYNG